MLGSLFLNIKAMRMIMFQLYGFYCIPTPLCRCAPNCFGPQGLGKIISPIWAVVKIMVPFWVPIIWLLL